MSTKFRPPHIVVFSAGAQGNVAPIAVIEGSSTAMNAPIKMRADFGGGVYLADYGAQALYYYAAGANGNVAPARTITTNLSSLYSFSGVGL